jgi:hypothetical protein
MWNVVLLYFTTFQNCYLSCGHDYLVYDIILFFVKEKLSLQKMIKGSEPNRTKKVMLENL